MLCANCANPISASATAYENACAIIKVHVSRLKCIVQYFPQTPSQAPVNKFLFVTVAIQVPGSMYQIWIVSAASCKNLKKWRRP